MHLMHLCVRILQFALVCFSAGGRQKDGKVEFIAQLAYLFCSEWCPFDPWVQLIEPSAANPLLSDTDTPEQLHVVFLSSKHT